eukprot:SAG22_NODE_1360_length_4622_cov_2.212912_7_plen_324_part_00
MHARAAHATVLTACCAKWEGRGEGLAVGGIPCGRPRGSGKLGRHRSRAAGMSDEEIDGMSVKQLKAHITAAGLQFADCVEKADLRLRAREASLRKAAPPAPSPAPAPASAAENIGRQLAGFDCVVVGPGQGTAVDLVVIMLHGYGATNQDFVPLAQLLGKLPGGSLAGKKVGWVFPQAPRGAMGMAEWWQIDVMEWMGCMQGGPAEIGKLIRKEFGGMPECRQQLTELVEAVQKEVFPAEGDSQPPPLCLAGFSQGAMTAMDLALGLPIGKVAGVAMLSGAPITVDLWAPKLKERAGKLKALVTHGQTDQVLPFVGSVWLKVR